MTDLERLFERVRSRAEQQTADLPPCIGEHEIAQAESALGFTLPLVLNGLYRDVANGGFGPEYYLLPLTGHGRTAVAEYGTLRTASGAYWPHGVLPVLDWGCGMYAAVDCLQPDAPVLLFEPNAGPADWADAWFLDSPSLAQWLFSWLGRNGMVGGGRHDGRRCCRTHPLDRRRGAHRRAETPPMGRGRR